MVVRQRFKQGTYGVWGEVGSVGRSAGLQQSFSYSLDCFQSGNAREELCDVDRRIVLFS